MKKLGLGILIVSILVVAGAVLAAVNSPTGQRVYVLTDNSVVKTILGVNQEFPGVFSTEVSPQLKALKALGLIKTEPVQIYVITGKPVCGNGIIDRGENCELGLPGCPTGYVCENCKCVEETVPPERSCYPSTPKPWGIGKVNGGSDGAGVKVAVLDTGVYKDHLDLKGNVIDCKDATKVGIRDGCADNNGHGTHVAGTVLANGGADSLGIYGVAPKASLMAIKVCGNVWCWGDDIAAGIRYAAGKGANIISMSLGGDSPDSQIKSAVDYAVDAGVLVVAAAGNDGDTDGYGSVDYPGAYPNVVAVGAIDSSNNLAYFSSLGRSDCTSGDQEGCVELVAPGVDIESTWNSGCYNTISGTSMATPHVAGVAALMWTGNSTTTRAALRASALNLVGMSFPEQGYGLVQYLLTP